MMIVVPTFRVVFKLASGGPETILRVPETELRALTHVLIFNNSEFGVKKEDDPFAQAEDEIRQHVKEMA